MDSKEEEKAQDTANETYAQRCARFQRLMKRKDAPQIKKQVTDALNQFKSWAMSELGLLVRNYVGGALIHYVHNYDAMLLNLSSLQQMYYHDLMNNPQLKDAKELEIYRGTDGIHFVFHYSFFRRANFPHRYHPSIDWKKWDEELFS